MSLPLRAAFDEGSAALADLAQPERVGILEDRDNQAPVERDGDPDIDLGVADDRIGFERWRSRQVSPQRERDRLGHEIAERRA